MYLFILLQRHFMKTFSIHIKLILPGGYMYLFSEYFDFEIRVDENCNSNKFAGNRGWQHDTGYKTNLPLII